MVDTRKIAEATRKIQDFNRQIEGKKSTMDRIRKDKEYKIRDYESQLKREQDGIDRLLKQIADLKKQI